MLTKQKGCDILIIDKGSTAQTATQGRRNNMGKKDIIRFFNNYDTDFFCTEDDAREIIMELENDYEEYESKDDIPDDKVWDRIRLEEEFAWDDFKREINECMQDATYLLCGTVGRWNGRAEGGCFVETVEDIVRGFGCDCDYFKFYEQNGHFYVKCSHHDGTNFAEMKRVSDKGMEYYRNNEYDKDDEELHDTMWNSNFMTGLPHFGKKLGYTKAV